MDGLRKLSGCSIAPNFIKHAVINELDEPEDKTAIIEESPTLDKSKSSQRKIGSHGVKAVL